MNEQRSLKSLEFFVILVELTRFTCLLFERSFALFELSKDIVDADEVLLGAVELPLSLILTDAVLYDTGSLFDDPSSVFGLCRKDIVNSALSYERIAVTAKTRIKEKDRDVLKTAVDLVDLIFGFAGSVKPSGDANLREAVIYISVGIIESNGHLGIVHRTSGRCTVEYDIFHLAATELLNALLA